MARLIKLLPIELADSLVTPLLNHPRKSRRHMAYKVLRRSGVTLKLAHHLIETHKLQSDAAILELIARTESVVPHIDVAYLLENLDEEYWRMRVIEALLREIGGEAERWATDYPKEFIWAVGRTRNSLSMSKVYDLIEANRSNLDIISIYAWCLGQLGAAKQLAELFMYALETWPDSGLFTIDKR